MGFTTPCFIKKNTPELRTKLEILGYKESIGEKGSFLFTSCNIFDCIHSELELSNLTNNGFIDCGENEELFLAIAALRDDIDRGQWFVLDYDNIWEAVGCYQYKGDFKLCNYRDKWYGATDVATAHKATVKELIEYFSTPPLEKKEVNQFSFKCDK